MQVPSTQVGNAGGAGATRGVLNLPGVKEEVGLIGIHYGGTFVELVPWNGSVSWDVAPWGR